MSTRVNPSASSSGGIFAIFRNLSLSVKLIVAFILVTALAEVALAYFSTTTSSRELTINLGANLHARGVAQATTLINLIDQETINPLLTLGLNKAVQNSVIAANIRYSGTFAGIQEKLQATDRAWIAAEDNDPLILAYTTGDIAGQLRQYTNKFPQNTETFITDQYGALVATSSRTTDFYQGDKEWWKKAWNNAQGATYIGQPEYNAITQKYSIVIAVPVYVFNTLGIDVVSGVLRTTLDFNEILKIVSGFKLGESGRLDLVFPSGQSISSDNTAVHFLSADTLTRLQSIDPNSTYSQINFEGQSSLISQIPLSAVTDKPYLTNLGWKLIVHQDVSEALQPVTDGLNSTVTIGSVVLILVVLIAILVSRLVTRPIVRLTRTTGQFATGDFSQRADVGGNDEIGTLASGFNTMAAQLQDLVGTLEDRIASSTRDLQTVADVNAQISSVLDEQRLLQDVVDLTKERFRLYHAHIYLLDPTGRALTLASGAGHVGRQMVSEVRTIQLNNQQSIVANAARTRKGVIINDVSESKTFLPHPLLPDTESELAVPLVARGQLIGVLDVQSSQVGFFTQDMLSVIELLAGQIAVAISNARLYENAERSSRHERALGNIDRKIQDAVDMDEILQVTVRELGKALRVPYTAIELRLNQSDEESDNQGVLP